ncbi:unnamed protein product [Lepeophtheirus salmonis]|uniref:(salmon louse) hypothetical protein n=1 Tax=Lepeophtheirus salmonis TaxID=72036 RepID=A0A7R8D4Q6_LEPSM|nr:unnamed protein product [Lepeophtheirus salmonis]CAF3027847.1 unnamed protein product [Lepeophtheirus salmonis]
MLRTLQLILGLTSSNNFFCLEFWNVFLSPEASPFSRAFEKGNEKKRHPLSLTAMVNIERIQWHSGLLLILLPTLILAHLSLLGQEEDPLENGAILSYSESLTLSQLYPFPHPPQSTLKIECLSSNKSEGSVSYSFLYLSQLNETLDPPPPISSLSLKPKTVLTYEETTSLTCSLDETQDEGVSYSFVWLKNGEIVSESSGSTFLLRNVTQSATYGCLLKR